MDGSPSSKFLGLLRALARHEIEFIVVGGVAAILEGAPIVTFDLDVLVSRDPINLDRVLRLLDELHARYRDPAGRLLVPDASKLATLRLHLLSTELGAFDVLTTIGAGQTYEALLGRTVGYQLDDARILVLALEAVIETKEHAGRDKDHATLPVLRRTLERKSR